MKKIFILVLFIFPVFVFSQTPNPTPATTPTPAPQVQQPVQNNPAQQLQNRRSIGSLSKAFDDLEQEEEQRKKDEKLTAARQQVNELYRKPTKKEMQLVTVDEELRRKFSDFLKQENTGLTKFLNSSKCSGNANVVQVSEDCLNNTIPGAGASFSFRVNNYRIPQLADLSFTENTFVTVGQWIHGLLLEIGDIQLENVNLQSVEVEPINSFLPATDFESAGIIETKLLEGLKQGATTFYRLAKARQNTTYLLRSIAYRGKVVKSANGFVYNELDFDKRKDIIVVFRIVQISSDGSVTVLWKQLASKDSPKIS